MITHHSWTQLEETPILLQPNENSGNPSDPSTYFFERTDTVLLVDDVGTMVPNTASLLSYLTLSHRAWTCEGFCVAYLSPT